MKKSKQRSTQHPHLQRGVHPVSLMILLCAGVFLVAATISAFGDSYSVNARVAGVPPSTAALITDPSDGTVFTNATQTISGSCPDGAYVVLSINGQTSGTAWCSGSSFAIVATLSLGSNQLNAQDYNALNDPGPASPILTVTYTPPTPPTPPVTPPAEPVTLSVMEVDSGVPYVSATTVEETSHLPSFSGVAPPFSHITLIIHSNVITCETTADANGYWQCTLPEALPNGVHTVMITAITKSGQMLSLPTFRIHVTGAPVSRQPVAPPITITSNYHYQVYTPNQPSTTTLTLGGGRAPYTITVNWGDGHTTTNQVATAGALSLTHTYGPGGLVLLHAYTAKVTVIDSTGHATSSQFITLVRNPATGVTNTRYTPPSTWHTALSSLHDWLWLLWPAYLIVVLMLTSFVLGERKQYETDRIRTRLSKHKPRRSTHHHA